MRINNEKAVALILSYMAIMVLTIMASGFLLRSSNESQTAVGYSKSMRSFWLAEAGLQKALWELNVNNCANCTVCGTNKCITDTIASAGDYDVTINSAAKTITSVGSYPSRTASNKKTRTVSANLNSRTSLFSNAIVTRNNITMSNSAKIDSYDSSKGLYNTYYTDANGQTVLNVGANASVAINSTSSGALTMSNTTQINGAVSTGPGGTVQLSNTANVVIDSVTYTQNGTSPNQSQTNQAALNAIIPHTNTTQPASVVIPSNLTSLPLRSAINLYGQPTDKNGNPLPSGNQTITAGSYKYPSINLSNSSILNISGDVTLYVTGSTNLSNTTKINIPEGSSLKIYTNGGLNLSNTTSINNASKIPANFLFYSTATSGAFQMSNNTNIYAGIYAPDSSISLSNSAENFGAFVAKSLTLSNTTKIHYDESLGGAGGSSGETYSVTTWQEN